MRRALAQAATARQRPQVECQLEQTAGGGFSRHRVHGEAELLRERADTVLGSLEVQERSAMRLGREDDVLRHGHVGQHRRVLVHDRDAPRGKQPNESEQATNKSLVKIAGRPQTVTLVPDFEGVMGLMEKAAEEHKPGFGWGGVGLQPGAPPDWARVEFAPLPELTNVIRPGGLANQKAPRLQAVLRVGRLFDEGRAALIARQPAGADARSRLGPLPG